MDMVVDKPAKKGLYRNLKKYSTGVSDEQWPALLKRQGIRPLILSFDQYFKF